MKHLTASERPWVQKAGFILSFLANALHPSLIHHFAERVVFYYGSRPPDFCLRKEFRGRFIPLSEINFKSAVIASGAIPIASPASGTSSALPTGSTATEGFSTTTSTRITRPETTG